MTYALTSFINRALRWCSDSYFTHVTSVIDIIITFTEPLWCYIWHCSLPPSLIHLPPPLLLAPCRPDRSQFTQPHTLPTLPPPLPSSPLLSSLWGGRDSLFYRCCRAAVRQCASSPRRAQSAAPRWTSRLSHRGSPHRHWISEPTGADKPEPSKVSTEPTVIS